MENDRFPQEEILRSAAKGDLNALIELDKQGFLLCPDEKAADYADRIRSMHKRAHETLVQTSKAGGFEFYPGIILSENCRIPEPIMEEAAVITAEHYGFSIRWVPGYFIRKGLGILWGGCAISENLPDAVPVFIIRNNFRYSRKWFLYSRSELLSHELCHAGRSPLHDPELEELFAYAVSSSLLRRTLGNCFQRDIDAILFLLPVFLLLAVQIMIHIFDMVWIPIIPFWILAFLWPLWLLIRNFLQRRFYFQAEKRLKKSGFRNPAAALYRCRAEEVRCIAGMSGEQFKNYADSQSRNELRWKIISTRFGRE